MTVGLKPYRGATKCAAVLRPAPPTGIIGIPPTAFVAGSMADAAVRPLSATLTGGAVGAAFVHTAGTDNPPIDAALPTAPPIEPIEPRPAPETAAGRAASAALAALAAAFGIAWEARPSISLKVVTNSRVGEINRMNASKGVLASNVWDPVRPSNRSVRPARPCRVATPPAGRPQSAWTTQPAPAMVRR